MKRALILMILVLFLIGLVSFVFAVANNNGNQSGSGDGDSNDTNQDDEFCGTSTNGACETDGGCVTDGCSGQVCRAVSEESVTTTCEWLDCYDNEKYNMECGCVNNKCKWNKESDEDENAPRKEKGEINREQIQNIIQEKNRLKFEAKTGQECPENCTCTGVVVKCELEEGGREMTVYAQSGNIIVISKGGENATTSVTLYHHNKSLYGVFKDNETKEIKILPDQVKEKIRDRVRNRIIEHFNITLDEDGFYKIEAQKKARLFYLVPVREKFNAEIDAENGEIVRVRNPWWGFLARDVRE